MIKYFGAGADSSDNGVMRGLLEWLWKSAVLPVLRKFGFHPHKANPLPRVWWIGVGLMAKAPVHAATKFKRDCPHITIVQYCLPSLHLPLGSYSLVPSLMTSDIFQLILSHAIRAL